MTEWSARDDRLERSGCPWTAFYSCSVVAPDLARANNAPHIRLRWCAHCRNTTEAIVQSVIYDAIVVGSGISGGWAAKELTEKGLRVLVLERGRNVEHIKDYVNATKAPSEYLHRGGRTKTMEEAYTVLKRD